MDPHKCLLSDILGVLTVLDHPTNVCDNTIHVATDDLVESFSIVVSASRNQCRIAISHPFHLVLGPPDTSRCLFSFHIDVQMARQFTACLRPSGERGTRAEVVLDMLLPSVIQWHNRHGMHSSRRSGAMPALWRPHAGQEELCPHPTSSSRLSSLFWM